MNRTFLSLYLLIIVFIFFMGWGLDKLWQKFSPTPRLSHAQHELVDIVTDAIQNNEPLPTRIRESVTLFSHDDFASSDLLNTLRNEKRIVLHSADGSMQLFNLTPQHIIRLTLPQEPSAPSNYLYEILLTIFYLSIGLVVFIWVWPLMRDVKRLETHTKDFGIRVIPNTVQVLPGSAVSNLAKAFNQMAERIQELLASHKEMTYAVSHELRTPLARMKFAVAMLQNQKSENFSTEVINHLNSLLQDVSEMDSLITQLLTYAGYEQASGPLQQKQGDLTYLVNDLIERAHNSHHGDSVQTSIIDQSNHEPVFCDWHLMERAIFNLVHNAMRFAQQKIQITILSNEASYIIHIDDDGPGISEEDHGRVFESFVRLEGAANAQVRGFGLGLAIVKRVMKWHEGYAQVARSELGGAKFILQWPKIQHQ